MVFSVILWALGKRGGGTIAQSQTVSIASDQTVSVSSTDLTAVTGSKAAGIAAASSILTGGVYNSTLPTLTNDQQAAAQYGTRGSQNVTLFAQDSALAAGFTNVNSDTVIGTGGGVGLDVASLGLVFEDAVGWHRMRGNTTGLLVLPKGLPATSRSGTITLGGTAQNAMAANTARSGWTLINNSDTRMMVHPAGTATATAGIPLEPDEMANGNETNAISVFGATTGKAFTAWEN